MEEAGVPPLTSVKRLLTANLKRANYNDNNELSLFVLEATSRQFESGPMLPSTYKARTANQNVRKRILLSDLKEGWGLRASISTSDFLVYSHQHHSHLHLIIGDTASSAYDLADLVHSDLSLESHARFLS